MNKYFKVSLERAAQMDQETMQRKILHKIRVRILPFLFLLFLLSFLDRSNLGNAHSAMLHDTGITESQYTICVSVFFIPYMLFEAPSNILLKHTTAPIWFSCITVTWGIISVCMMFVQDFAGLLALRLALGLAEAGFLPGVVYFLSLWFTPAERAFAIGLVMSSVPFSGLISGLAAYGLLQMDGLGGVHGWQWLYLIEGLPSIIVGLLVPWVLPAKPGVAPWLTVEEQDFAIKRLDSRTFEKSDLRWEHFKAVLLDVRLWLCALITMSVTSSSYSIFFFLPSLIEQFGFSTLVSNLLSAPIHFISFLALISNGLHSDKTKERFLHLLIPSLLALLGWGLTAYALLEARGTPPGLSLLVMQYLSILIAAVGTCMTFPIILTWPVEYYIPGSHEMSLGSALSIGIGNMGGILGPQIWNVARGYSSKDEAYAWGAFGLAVTACLSCILSVIVWIITKKRYGNEEEPLVGINNFVYL